MRAGFGPELLQRVRRADGSIRLIPEITAVQRSDAKASIADWADSDSYTGYEPDPEGGMRIAGGLTTVIQLATSDSNITDLDGRPQDRGAQPFDVAKVEWGGSESATVELSRFSARLNPDTGGGQDVDTWYAQVWAVTKVHEGERLELTPLCDPIAVSAGASETDVAFDFPAPVNPKLYGPPINGREAGYNNPTTFVFVWAVQDDGTPATNVAWLKDSTVPNVTTASNVLTGFRVGIDTEGFYTEESGLAGTPRCKFERGSYSAVTITFSTTKRLDLGATPTGTVRFLVRGRIPAGCSLTWEVRNDADTAWVTLNDGDTTDDLAGVGKNQYYQVRVTLTPTSSGDATPTVLLFAVEESTLTSLDNLATVQGQPNWAVDPFTLKGEVVRATLVAIHEGLKDYRDAITKLLSENDIGKMDVRLWLGASDLDRQYWGLIEQFIVDDTAGLGPAAELELLSPLMLLRADLPVYKSATTSRDPYTRINETLKDSYDDIIDNQLGLPGRYRGDGIQDDTTQVTKIVRRSDVKAELDALAFIDGSAIIASQGRATVRNFYGDKRIKAIFPASEIRVTHCSPGFAKRVPEFFIKWDWLEAEDRFDVESNFINQSAFDALGVGRVFGVQHLPEIVGRWLTSQTLAETIGKRAIRFFSTGQPSISFISNYAYPELEPGDAVAVEVDRFIAKDPRDAERFLKGKLWALCVLSGQHDFWGRNFTGWIRTYSDLLGAAQTVTVGGYLNLARCHVYHATNQTFAAGSDTDLNFDSEETDTDAMHDTVTNNQRITVVGTDNAIAGDYTLEANLEWINYTATPSTYGFVLTIALNGADGLVVRNLQQNIVGTSGTIRMRVPRVTLASGDYVTLHISGPSGPTASITFVGGVATATYLKAIKLPNTEEEVA